MRLFIINLGTLQQNIGGGEQYDLGNALFLPKMARAKIMEPPEYNIASYNYGAEASCGLLTVKLLDKLWLAKFNEEKSLGRNMTREQLMEIFTPEHNRKIVEPIIKKFQAAISLAEDQGRILWNSLNSGLINYADAKFKGWDAVVELLRRQNLNVNKKNPHTEWAFHLDNHNRATTSDANVREFLQKQNLWPDQISGTI